MQNIYALFIKMLKASYRNKGSMQSTSFADL